MKPDNLTSRTIRATGGKRATPKDSPSSKKDATSRGIPNTRPDLATDLRKVLGEIVDITWGVGSQQIKFVARGEVLFVQDDLVLLGKPKGCTMFVPLSFIVRWCQ